MRNQEEFWAVASRLQIPKMYAFELIGYSGRAARARPLVRLSPSQRKNDLSEIEVAVRGLHLPKSWMNHPRRVSPFFGRTPLELMIGEDGKGFGQVIEFLAELTFNRRIR
jgi:hypothetical protein